MPTENAVLEFKLRVRPLRIRMFNKGQQSTIVQVRPQLYRGGGGGVD